MHLNEYDSPLGKIYFAYDEIGLCGLWFEGQKYFESTLKGHDSKKTEMYTLVKNWLDEYFQGNNPKMDIPLHLIGTSFQLEVWNILQSIPYGKTTTYGKIAQIIAEKKGIEKMSSQAIGGAVGRNPISIIIPCHRVVGSDGSLTGYASGLDKKKFLLELESKS